MNRIEAGKKLAIHIKIICETMEQDNFFEQWIEIIEALCEKFNNDYNYEDNE
jgi:hypothetical protein